jgi:hypothetical protein
LAVDEKRVQTCAAQQLVTVQLTADGKLTALAAGNFRKFVETKNDGIFLQKNGVPIFRIQFFHGLKMVKAKKVYTPTSKPG